MASQSHIDQAAKLLAEGLPIGPTMFPCACGAGRHAHSGSNRAGSCKATGCRRYRANVAYTLALNALDAQHNSLGRALRESDARDRAKHSKMYPRKPGEWSIGPSDTSTCRRRIWYRNKPPEGYVPAITDGREARMGTIIHREVTRRLQELFPWRQYAQRIRVEGLDRDAELDWYDPVTGEVTDLKTAGDWKWDMLRDAGPDEEVWGQAFLYGLALEDMGKNVRTIKIVYVKRCNGHDEEFERPWDRVYAEKWRTYLLDIATRLDLDLDLPRDGAGPSNDPLCRRCEARVHCWNMDAAEEVGRTPESVTMLGIVPAEPEVIWAIEEKVNASATRLHAEKQEEQYKGLVDGLEPGRYGEEGEWEVWLQKQKGRPAYKVDSDRLREAVRRGEEIDPDAPVPRGDDYEITKVGRVRKATLDKERRENAVLPKPRPPALEVVPDPEGEA